MPKQSDSLRYSPSTAFRRLFRPRVWLIGSLVFTTTLWLFSILGQVSYFNENRSIAIGEGNLHVSWRGEFDSPTLSIWILRTPYWRSEDCWIESPAQVYLGYTGLSLKFANLRYLTRDYFWNSQRFHVGIPRFRPGVVTDHGSFGPEAVVPTSGPMLASLACVLFARYRRQRIPPGCCQNCGYNLTGNVSGVCPECGVAIESRGSKQAG